MPNLAVAFLMIAFVGCYVCVLVWIVTKQDKKIKKLESENKELKNYLNSHRREINLAYDRIGFFEKEAARLMGKPEDYFILQYLRKVGKDS